MATAARLAMRARPLSHPNPAVGALIVRDGRVIARGWTQAGGRPHAEAMALDAAGDRSDGATLYATLEPCAHTSSRGPSCTSLIASSRLARVVAGVVDPDPRTAGQGLAAISAAGIVAEHIGNSTCSASLAGYLTQRQQGRPHVTLKLAMSLDGCIAMASGESQWITGQSSRAHVHSRRAMADAILVGGETWRTDRPSLDVRLPGLEDRSPQRLVLTRGAAPEGVTAIAAPDGIRNLADVQYLYIEGGAQTAAAFLQADLVDRIELYRAPIVIGEGRMGVGDIGLAQLADAHDRWLLTERRQLGTDSYEAYDRTRAPALPSRARNT
ncbi:bifunctional diaminohydroxyphosphoribosylaminopyrimidine deaminase/5-amino-6-(5-phosphoribosylamino)uracil reductase RibD [Alteripontixanthobacter maritimus]